MTMLHIVQPDEGFIGPTRILAGAEQTDGRYFLLEWETLPEDSEGLPLRRHAHETYAEAEYVLTGEREIFVDDASWRGGPGLFVLAPRRAVHTMRTVGDAPSRWLHFFSPAGLERLFVERERLRAEGAPEHELRALSYSYGNVLAPSRPATEPTLVVRPEDQRDQIVVTDDYTLAERSVLDGYEHVHETQEEAFYVMNGELMIEVEGRSVTATARWFVLVPRGVSHRHTSSSDAQLLAIFSPGTETPH